MFEWWFKGYGYRKVDANREFLPGIGIPYMIKYPAAREGGKV